MRLISAFYVCLYAFLAAWFIICFMVFLETLDNTVPKWSNEVSLTQGNPGLSLRPMPQYDSTLIRFEQGNPSSYKPYTDHLEAFLLDYELGMSSQGDGRRVTECAISEGATRAPEAACRVNLDDVLGDCTTQKDYGYEDGEPCVLLKMNRVFGFVPEPYMSLAELNADNGYQNDTLRFLAFTKGLTIGISCEGENPADRENIMDGGIEFYPNPRDTKQAQYSGIPVIHFPFLNQEGYKSPFIMVKFKKFNKRVVIQVVCKLYAKNIDNSGTSRRHGIMRFELLKD